MTIIGLTGGYATGKSFVASCFAQLGAKLIDCDLLAREVTMPGTEGFRAVVDEFGDSVLGADGSIDREALGKIVFSDPTKRKILESILHPIIIGVALQRANNELAKEPNIMVVIEAALLFESGLYKNMDKSIAVICDDPLQISRGMQRDNLPKQDALRRIEAQWPLIRKTELADFVIDNNRSKEETKREVTRLFDEIGS